jgi:hypothetical protein
LSYMTLQLLHSEFPYIWGKFDFLFYQCNSIGKRWHKAEYGLTSRWLYSRSLRVEWLKDGFRCFWLGCCSCNLAVFVILHACQNKNYVKSSRRKTQRI